MHSPPPAGPTLDVGTRPAPVRVSEAPRRRPVLLRAIGRLRRVLLPTLKEKSHARWVREGAEARRVEYPLGPASVVVDVGGFEGNWTAAMVERFGCTVHVFEPVPEFVERLERRFRGDPRVHLHGVGLGDRDRRQSIVVAGDGSSLVHGRGPSIEIDVARAADHLSAIVPSGADLMKVNIEGAEYELLEHLAETKWLGRFAAFQIQFHEWTPGATRRRAEIRRELERTHRLQWDYPWIWESWERRLDPRGAV